MTTITLSLPLASVPNSNDREHRMVTYRREKAMREAMMLAARGARPVPGKVKMRIGFAFPDRRVRDLTNVSTKGLLDGLVAAGVIEDDRWAVLSEVTLWRMEHKSPWKYLELRFEIEPA